MLQVIDNTIQEIINASMQNAANTLTGSSNLDQYGNNCYPGYPYYQQPYYYWTSYPVYITTDKTKKAVDILKVLQAEKLLECKSVNKFIELVEKISNLL